VLVAIASLIGAEIWVVTLTPAVNPSLTVDPPKSWMEILFWAGLIVGTVLGVRIAWDLLCFFAILMGAFLLISAIGEPHAQTIGGAILIAVGVVLLFLPHVRDYETKRIRVVSE
jgi:hypothetical protein